MFHPRSAIFALAVALTLSFATSCRRENTPRADYVIFIGVDAMSAVGVQRAETPNFNRLIAEGAVSVHTRGVRETSSSQNWMSMVSASPIEIHGVFTNKWKADDPGNVPPALSNNIGLYPTIFDHIKKQKPELRQYAYIEWAGETRMYDTSVFDRCVVRGVTEGVNDYHDVANRAFSDYLQDRPEMMFLSLDITDHIGHTFGHESQTYFDTITELDGMIGAFVNQLEQRGWMKNTVIIITADHGGIAYGHGGDTVSEYETPIIMYGKGVTKGKVMKQVPMIYDTGATAASLLGIELPFECHGKLLTEAFEPSDGDVYVPVPLAHPYQGAAKEGVVLTVDDPEAEIHYTTDGSEPTEASTLYTGPVKIEGSTRLRSIAVKKGSRSIVAENFFYPEGTLAPISYKLYKNVMDDTMPDFTKFGLADRTGFCNHFDLSEFGMEEEDHFAILYTSNFIAPKDGKYRFEIVVDDWAYLYIDGKLTVKAHSVTQPTYGIIDLTAGPHKIKLEYYEHSHTQSLDLKYSIDGSKSWPVFPTDLER